MGMMETIIEILAEHERNVFGQFDALAKKIVKTYEEYEVKNPEKSRNRDRRRT